MTPPVQEHIQVLHVDDDPDFGDLTKTFLEHEDERINIADRYRSGESHRRSDRASR